MKALKAWAEPLGLALGTLNAWLAEAPQNINFTFWCLARGKIRSSDYFAWAMEHYQLAMVNEKYFSQPIDRKLWNKIKTVANWSPQMLPLEEWDGVVFVACVEPPDDIHWSFPVRYVLATARDLQLHWERLESEPTRVAGKTAVQDPSHAFMSTIPVIPAATPQSPEATVHLSPTPLSLPEIPAPSAEAADLAEEAPAGLAINFVVPPLTIPPDGVAKEDIPPPPTVEEPTGILPLAQVTSVSLRLGPEDKTALTTPTFREVPLTAFVPEGTHANTASRTGLVSAVLAAPPLPAEDHPAIGKSPVSGSIDSDRLAPLQLSANSSETDAVAWGFQQLKQHFNYSWLMLVQGETLIPYCWDAAVTPTSPHSKDPIDLTQPSLFRIVVRTRMPYHGHVVESPINTGFFRMWGLRQTPPHVTAIPLSSSGHLVALLLCAGDKPSQLDQVLRFAEKTGNSILGNLGKRQSSAA